MSVGYQIFIDLCIENDGIMLQYRRVLQVQYLKLIVNIELNLIIEVDIEIINLGDLVYMYKEYSVSMK